MNSPRHEHEEITREVFDDQIVQLAAICPLCALSALSPAAALAALSPMLRVFNPAVNPNAALLSFVSQLNLVLAMGRLNMAAGPATPQARMASHVQMKLAPGMGRLFQRVGTVPRGL